MVKQYFLPILFFPWIAFAQTPPSMSNPLGSSGTGVGNIPPAADVRPGLTIPQAQVSPSTLPDRFEFGRQSALTDVNDYQIKDLLARVSSIESSVSWGRGLVYAAVSILAILALFLKAFWRPILRMLMQEAREVTSSPSS